MRERASGRHERLQSPAGALGQRADADGEENPAPGTAVRCSAAREMRSFLPSHREHQLSVDGAVLRHAAAGDDRALLPGLVSDAADRSAAVSGVHVLNLQLLSGGAKGTAAEEL